MNEISQGIEVELNRHTLQDLGYSIDLFLLLLYFHYSFLQKMIIMVEELDVRFG